MKKSMILAAAVVAAGLGASANATFFSINNAGWNGLGQLGNFQLQTNTVANVMTGGGTDITTGAGGIIALDATAVTDIVNVVNTALGGAVGATPRLTYFGMSNGGSQGYFAVVFQNNATARDWSVNIGQAASASNGIFVGAAGFLQSTLPGGAFDTEMDAGNGGQLAANGVYVAIFSGMGVGASIGGSNLSDTNFDVNYLSFAGTAYSSFKSAAGISNSNINAATYSIPVPAPALLAGAGLVGAAAIRRRMAKKA